MRSPSKADDYDELIRRAPGKRLALLSESSHGTREFHARRGRITRRLIDELGFAVVAVEADSPDASQVNSFVRGDSSAPTAERALGGVQRFPTWMWRNDDVVGLLEWMRGRNPGFDHAGFYGIDLYSFHSFHGGAKCAAGKERGTLLPLDVPWPCHQLESARYSHGDTVDALLKHLRRDG